MKSIIKTRFLIYAFFGLVGEFLLGIVCILFTVMISQDFNLVGVTGFLIVSGLTIIGSPTIFLPFKRISIDKSKEIVSTAYFGIFKRVWGKDEIEGYCIQTIWSRYGTFEHTTLQTKKGKQIDLSSGIIKNYDQMRDTIIAIYRELPEMNRSEWLIIKNPILLAGVIWLMIVMVIMIAN